MKYVVLRLGVANVFIRSPPRRPAISRLNRAESTERLPQHRQAFWNRCFVRFTAFELQRNVTSVVVLLQNAGDAVVVTSKEKVECVTIAGPSCLDQLFVGAWWDVTQRRRVSLTGGFSGTSALVGGGLDRDVGDHHSVARTRIRAELGDPQEDRRRGHAVADERDDVGPRSHGEGNRPVAPVVECRR